MKGSEEAGIQPREPGGNARGFVGLLQGEVSPGGPDRPVKSPDLKKKKKSQNPVDEVK